jgi:hypothetical protein
MAGMFYTIGTLLLIQAVHSSVDPDSQSPLPDTGFLTNPKPDLDPATMLIHADPADTCGLDPDPQDGLEYHLPTVPVSDNIVWVRMWI